MPLDRFVLMLILVVIAAGATVFLASLTAGALHWPGLGLAVLIPISLVIYIVVRVVTDRLRSREDDRYDRVER